MINYFTDRHPALSAIIIAVLFTVVPSATMLAVDTATGGTVNMPVVIFLYALVIQVILWMNVERPILVFMPFIISLIGFIVAELIYTVSESTALPGAGADPVTYVASSVIVTVFGAESAASVGAIICYGIILLGRKIWESVFKR